MCCVEYKNDHISETNIHTIKTHKSVSEHRAFFFNQMVRFFRYMNDYISKTTYRKNRKIEFSLVSEHCDAVLNKKIIKRILLRVEGSTYR